MSHSPKTQLLSSSQREHQALQDLVDLAEEGMSASPLPSSLGVPIGETLGDVLGLPMQSEGVCGSRAWAVVRLCAYLSSVEKVV